MAGGPSDTTGKARTISLLNMKGGVGKTTLAVNLAWWLYRHSRKRVLLVDLDPQFNASQYLMAYSEWDRHRRSKGTVANVLLEPERRTMRLKVAKKAANKKAAPRIPRILKYVFQKERRSHAAGRLDILPSELALAKAVKNPEGVPYRLEKALDTIRGRYDFIFIDCAPTDSVLTDTALMASNYILIPVRPDRYSVLGYAHIQESLGLFRGTYPDPHNVIDLGVVFNHVTGNSRIEKDCMVDMAREAEFVFDTSIRVSQSYLRAAHEQTPVFQTRYARRLTASAIASLVDEMNDRILDLESGDEGTQ